MLSLLFREWKNSNIYKSIVLLIREVLCCTCCKVPLRLPVLTGEKRDEYTPNPGLLIFNSDDDTPNFGDGENWVSMTEEPPALLGLRLTFTPGNLPPNDLAAWNTFFDLPANGTAFTSMTTVGDEVTLFGGAGITLMAGLFRTSTTLLKIEDDVDCVVAINGGKDLGALSLCSALTTVTLNGVITIGAEALRTNTVLTSLSMNALISANKNAFENCQSIIIFNLPLLEVAGAGVFKNCTSVTTFNLPELTSANADCFAYCTSVTTFNLPLLETAYVSCFNECISANTFDLPSVTTIGGICFNNCTNATTFKLNSCTNLGGSTGNDSVFLNILGNTITITVPTALSTCDSGNPDGDLVYLDGNNTVTINYI